MSDIGERTLIQHLADADSLRIIAEEGLDPEVIPTDDLRKIVVWSLDYFHRGGLTLAPTAELLRDNFGDVLDEHEIDVTTEVEITIQWAIDDLRDTYVHHEGQEYVKDLAISLSGADRGFRVDVLKEATTHLMSVLSKVESRRTKANLRVAASDRALAYIDRASEGRRIFGMELGLPEIDNFTLGIRPGELAILAGPPKSGKSMVALFVAFNEWLRGRHPMLFTLENSIEMTVDRLFSIGMHLSGRDWQQGTLSHEMMDPIGAFVEMIKSKPQDFFIHQPDLGQRSFEYMISEAALHGADSVIIDQLTFVELGGNERRPKHERIGDALHRLKGDISTGVTKLPVLLVHQINRDGVEAARKEGRLRMEHMAESAEVERTADWVFGVYRPGEAAKTLGALFDILAARRANTQSWKMLWNIETGLFRVLEENTYAA